MSTNRRGKRIRSESEDKERHRVNHCFRGYHRHVAVINDDVDHPIPLEFVKGVCKIPIKAGDKVVLFDIKKEIGVQCPPTTKCGCKNEDGTDCNCEPSFLQINKKIFDI